MQGQLLNNNIAADKLREKQSFKSIYATSSSHEKFSDFKIKGKVKDEFNDMKIYTT